MEGTNNEMKRKKMDEGKEKWKRLRGGIRKKLEKWLIGRRNTWRRKETTNQRKAGQGNEGEGKGEGGERKRGESSIACL